MTNIPCKTCGKKIVRDTSQRTYCSRECKPDYTAPRRCKTCGKTFAPVGSAALRQYCSRECRARSRQTLIACAHCRASFCRTLDRKTYCSDQCKLSRAPAVGAIENFVVF